jgi:DNA-binding HxlR family transcriptional regulator
MTKVVRGAKAPVPGRPVRGSTTGRPIMAALDLLGRRWSLRIVWELLARSAGFRDLQSRCGDISASVLSTRLQELGQAAIVETDAHGKWRLTRLGAELIEALSGLQSWSAKWAKRVASTQES